MREQFSSLSKDRMIYSASLASSLILLFQLAFIIITLAHLPPVIPFLYQQPWGAKQIAQKEFIFILFAISSAFMVVNIVLAAFIYREIPLLSRMLVWASLFICSLSTISAIRIILLVI